MKTRERSGGLSPPSTPSPIAAEAQPEPSLLDRARLQRAHAHRKIQRTPLPNAPSGEAPAGEAAAEAKAIDGQAPPIGPDGKPYDPATDTNFGKPFDNPAEAAFTKAWLNALFVPSVSAAFGSEVGKIWQAFLHRKPGDSLAPRRYGPGDPIGDAFIRNPMTHQVTQEVLAAAQDMFVDPQSGPEMLSALKPNEPTPFELDRDALKDIEIVYPNPADIPGHLAGGVSGSDAGKDSRSIEGSVSALAQIDPAGAVTALDLQPKFSFHVADAVDFLPGGAGAGIEQIFTVPLSRLEASGQAYDVPFVVDFPAPDTRIGAPLPEGNGREKHLTSVLEVAHTFKEKGFKEAAELVGEKAKTASTSALEKAANKAKKLKDGGVDAVVHTAEGAVGFVLDHLFGIE